MNAKYETPCKHENELLCDQTNFSDNYSNAEKKKILPESNFASNFLRGFSTVFFTSVWRQTHTYATS